jgi:hypothetical protein
VLVLAQDGQGANMRLLVILSFAMTICGSGFCYAFGSVPTTELHKTQVISYAKSVSESIEAFCPPGFTLLKGSCRGENKSQETDDHHHGMSTFNDRQYGIYFTSEPIGDSGWRCRPKMLHPKQVLLVYAQTVCQKTNDSRPADPSSKVSLFSW